jgi:hypothetical protein
LAAAGAAVAGSGLWWRSRMLLIGVAVVVALGVGLFLLTSSEDAGAEVILEPTASTGEDPFTDSVAKADVSVKGGGFKQVAGGKTAVVSVTGSAPGLYGGTGEQAVCDGKAMVAFLKRNPDKAAAFAGVVGVTPAKIEDYVAKLTPVLLREDTRVTNHGFAGGRATALQSVLQAGTAVMVDDRGVPRVRCACGNPLSEPAAVSSRPHFKGRRWQSFDDKRLVAVSASERPVKSFKLVNVRTGKSYELAAGPTQKIVMGASGVAERVGGWRITSNGPTVTDAAKSFGSDFKTESNSLGGCETKWSRAGVKAVTVAAALGAGGKCIVEGQPIFYLLITSPDFQTEQGLRVGMSEGDVTRLHPRASSEQASGQPIDDEIYPTVDNIYSLVTVPGVSASGDSAATLAALVSGGRVVALQVTTFLAD